MMKFRFRRQGNDPQREKIKQELFAFNKTVEHGFPHQPSALAFDPQLQLMAIGTKSGAIKIYGAPGVEFTGLHRDTAVVAQIHFLQGQGRLCCRCLMTTRCTCGAGQSFRDRGGAILGAKREGVSTWKKKHNYSLWTTWTRELQCEPFVTVLLLLRSVDLLCVGTEGGGIHFLDTATPLAEGQNQSLLLDQVMQSVPEDYRCGKSLDRWSRYRNTPSSPGKILIGYSRGLVVLWDLSTRNAEHMFWGKTVVTPTHTSPCPRPSPTVHSLVKPSTRSYGGPSSSSGCPIVLYSGGMPRAQLWRPSLCDHPTGQTTRHTRLHIQSDRLLHCPHRLTWSTTMTILQPWVVLGNLEEELVVIDLLTTGWPSVLPPYTGPAPLLRHHHILSPGQRPRQALGTRLAAAGKSQVTQTGTTD
ncbi:hypothetical protein J4Q44_G00182830 [Coregonus suidteri]|uniref:Uncharacterized protein n=1 Tax=Coregonus suidteri TaxID=861788 RepID=A0AAN8QQS7_9TELE